MRFHSLTLRLRALLLSRRMDDDLDDEVRLHMEMQTRKHVAAGLTPEEARRCAVLTPCSALETRCSGPPVSLFLAQGV